MSSEGKRRAGRLGGSVTSARYGIDHMQRIARRGGRPSREEAAAKAWGKIKQAQDRAGRRRQRGGTGSATPTSPGSGKTQENGQITSLQGYTSCDRRSIAFPSRPAPIRVAVVNCSPVYNLGCHKIAQYHRLRGDEIALSMGTGSSSTEALTKRGRGQRHAGALPQGDFDAVYLSAIFTWDLPYLAEVAHLAKHRSGRVEIGGPAPTFMAQTIERETGVVPHRGLDHRFEHVPGEYELVFTSRGCPRGCAFCGVKKVEPDHLEYDEFPLATMVGDNNILATSWRHQELVVERLLTLGRRKIDFNSGFDVRFFHEEHFQLYSQLRLVAWRFAFDSMGVEDDVRRVAAMMTSHGLDRHKVTFYCLIGFPSQTPEECHYRLRTIIELGHNPYPMRFWPLNRMDRKYVARGWTKDLLQRMTAYYQTPYLWMSHTWENYRPGKRGAKKADALAT